MTSRFYRVLGKIPWLRNEVNRVRQSMQMYYPGDTNQSDKKAAGVCLRLWGVCLGVGGYFICMGSFSFEEICLVLCSLIMG